MLMRWRVLLTVGLVFVACAIGPPPTTAHATGSGCSVVDAFGNVQTVDCSAWGGSSRTPPSSGAPANQSSGSTSGTATCSFGQLVIPCTSSAGSWSGGCYLQTANPQPPLDDPAWLGNTDGLILVCTPYPCVISTGATIPDCPSISRYWAAAPPAGVAIDEPTAARRAIAQLDLDPITVTMAPKPNLADPNVLIGAPAFFWAEGGTPAIGPLATTVTQDGLTISLQATLDHVTFDTGDGGSVTCTRDQIEHAPAHMDFDVIPECGHTWLHPGVLTLSATSAWTITWQGPTQSGTLDHTLDASIDVAITDRPVNLTTNG